MHSYLDLELGRAGALEMGGEVEGNRLESRLAGARRASGALSEELLGRRPRTRMAARAVAAVGALFR